MIEISTWFWSSAKEFVKTPPILKDVGLILVRVTINSQLPLLDTNWGYVPANAPSGKGANSSTVREPKTTWNLPSGINACDDLK